MDDELLAIARAEAWYLAALRYALGILVGIGIGYLAGYFRGIAAIVPALESGVRIERQGTRYPGFAPAETSKPKPMEI